MINVFEKLAPSYKRLVRKYALDIWKDRLTKQKEKEFLKSAENFKKRYQRELIKHYQNEDIKIHYGTITAKANQWLVDQRSLLDSIKVIAKGKKEKLTTELFEKLRTDQTGDVQKQINKLYLTEKDIKSGEEVYRVFSFADNLAKKAEQLGEENAFELGKDINHAVISGLNDRYEWQTQQDKHVRKTHKKLNKKTFLYSNPPKTIDKYGNIHVGAPGTDWGCRCYEVPSNSKPLLNYVARE